MKFNHPSLADYISVEATGLVSVDPENGTKTYLKKKALPHLPDNFQHPIRLHCFPLSVCVWNMTKQSTVQRYGNSAHATSCMRPPDIVIYNIR